MSKSIGIFLKKFQVSPFSSSDNRQKIVGGGSSYQHLICG